MPPIDKDQLAQAKPQARSLDGLDRKILGALTLDATRSYAELGLEVGLSAPAVHERVKRLRASGVIKRTSAQLNGPSLGKDFLAFVHIESSGKVDFSGLDILTALPEVEEVHTVTGDTGLIIKIRMDRPEAMEGFLWRLYDIAGLKSSKTYVVLSTHLERGVQAGTTPELSVGKHFE
jgi:DNA-binding Lrp family transcriptional regulator